MIQAAEIFTSVILAVQRGKTIKAALSTTMDSGIWQALPDEWWESALQSAAFNETDAAALHRHGLSCRTDDAFPGCHLAAVSPRR